MMKDERQPKFLLCFPLGQTFPHGLVLYRRSLEVNFPNSGNSVRVSSEWWGGD